MKGFWEGLGGEVTAALLPVIVLGIVALLIWRKIFGSTSTVTDVVNNTLDSAATIPSGLASLVGSAIRGESLTGSNYITDAQMRQMAAENLAKAQGRL